MSALAAAGGSLLKTAMAIREEARRERFLDSKTRTIGLNVDALDAAVAEHKEQARVRAAEEAAYADYVSKINAMAMQNERDAMQEEIDAQVGLLAVWEEQSDKTKRREWDLNDPRMLSKERVLREGDDDPRCGPASMLKFDGEDLHKAERELRLMQEQMAGIEKQLADIRSRKAAAADEEREYAQYQRFVLDKTLEAELEFQREQLQERISVASQNKMLARARRVRERDAAAEAKMKEAEQVDYISTDPYLTESRVLAVNFSDPRRVRREHFKGMTREQLAAIYKEQEEQRKELAARRAAAKKEEEDWARRVRMQTEAAAAMEAEAAAEKAKEQREYYLALKAQQRAARLGKQDLNETYKNKVDPSYFDKFNATSHI